MHSSSGSTERSEAPWASSDQPNARGFSPNSLNKQASAAALCWAQNINHVSANPQKTITIIRSREHSDPRPWEGWGFKLVPLGAPISIGAEARGQIFLHPSSDMFEMFSRCCSCKVDSTLQPINNS